MIEVATRTSEPASAMEALPVVEGDTPGIFEKFYQEDTTIVIWHRCPAEAVTEDVGNLITARPSYQDSMCVSPARAYEVLEESIGPRLKAPALVEDIAALVDMFCCLFELKQAGLRLSVLNKAMCPRFHVDRVPGRLVTTYNGLGTEWLPHAVVDRTKLGLGNEGKPDEVSGLFRNESDIQRLAAGDVALLKGELWPGNEGGGLVHRSPTLTDGQTRLLLTFDFASDD